METQRHQRANQILRTKVPKLRRGFCFGDCLYKSYHVNSHKQYQKASITKHIAKVISEKKIRIWQSANPVCLPKNRVTPDKQRGTPPPLPPRPAQFLIAKPTPPCTWVEIPTKNANNMSIHQFYQSDASKTQQDTLGKKNNSQPQTLGISVKEKNQTPRLLRIDY